MTTPTPQEALREISNLLVCAPLSKPEDMAQSFQYMYELAEKALAQQAQGLSDDVVRTIKETLLNVRLQHHFDEEAGALPLVDLLTTGETIKEGEEEIELIANEIAIALLSAAPAQPSAESDAKDAERFRWLIWHQGKFNRIWWPWLEKEGSYDELRETIDAAIAQSNQGE